MCQFSENKPPNKSDLLRLDTGCFTIPRLRFPFCHFSIILSISVTPASFLKLPLFPIDSYNSRLPLLPLALYKQECMWGNQAATVTCKTTGLQIWDLQDCALCQSFATATAARERET